MAPYCRKCGGIYSPGHRIPVTLTCGHSYCRKCLNTIQGPLRCPGCGKAHNGLPLKDLSINHDLLTFCSMSFPQATPRMPMDSMLLLRSNMFSGIAQRSRSSSTNTQEHTDEEGNTKLHVAAEAGDKRTVETLVKDGADIEAVNNCGLTPIHLAAWGGHTYVVVVLLQCGADPTTRGQGRTLVHWAAVGGHTTVLEAVLEKCDLTERTEDEMTALHLAADHGNPATVEWLVKMGLNHSTRDKKGFTAEDYARQSGHKEIFTYLHRQTAKQQNEFFEAVTKGDLLVVKALLEAEVNIECRSREADEWGHRPMHRAALLSHLPVLKLLLQCGAKRDVEDDMGNSVMHFAAYGGNVAVLNFLKENGCTALSCNNLNFTTLHFAAMSGRESAIEWLLQEGVATDIVTDNGYRAADIAQREGHSDMAELLRNRAAGSEGQIRGIVVQRKLGEGAFGKVFLVTLNNRQLVLKKVSLENASAQVRDLAVQEYQVMKKLRHPNITSFLCGRVTGTSLDLLMEYCSGGDLAGRIEERKQKGSEFRESVLIVWTRQLCLALEYMHGRNILHRDIKPHNIFLSSSGAIKLGDFGLVRTLAEGSVALTTLGTYAYMSPEVMNEQPYDSKADMWSLGCSLYELVALKKGYPYTNVCVPGRFSEGYKELIKALLSQAPQNRPSAAQALQRSCLKESSSGSRSGNASVRRAALRTLIEMLVSENDASTAP